MVAGLQFPGFRVKGSGFQVWADLEVVGVLLSVLPEIEDQSFRTDNGSSQGQNLVLNASCVTNLLTYVSVKNELTDL